MNYLANYYKTLSEDLQRRLNQLINEASTSSIAMDGGQEPRGEPGEIIPSDAYEEPYYEWENVPWNPDLPQNPLPPQSPDEWIKENPMPDPGDYDNPEEYHRAVGAWEQRYWRIMENYDRWEREVERRNRPGGFNPGPDPEFV